ncbi:MAG: TrmH family RNA methyltransferase [Spirochaetaceae bacterium]|jgi:TrmH family RNA methyltransferase|nr:TrmH family RNA methyltransferase [Spirochaetaceae bacterium]
MIPPGKLEKLPRTLRLRKTVKLLEEAERRLLSGMAAPEADWPGILALIQHDVPAEHACLVHAAQAALEPAASHAGAPRLLRCLNALRHCLLAETGKAPADWDFIDRDGGLDPGRRLVFPGVWVYLEDIRSPFNVGSLFRTAESFGAARILLSPFCADPRHRRAERTAKGCVSLLPWERLGLDGLLRLGAPAFALETGGTALDDFSFPAQGVMLVGSEELGLSPEALAGSDKSLGRVSIPTYGAKGSLNVSVAFGIVMRAWAERARLDRAALLKT